jgi:hypothetical protein
MSVFVVAMWPKGPLFWLWPCAKLFAILPMPKRSLEFPVFLRLS